MSITLQEPPALPLPVICDFYFEQAGPSGAVTYDGDSYPYPPLPSDKGSDYRYALGTTPAYLAVEFFATEYEEHQHVITPPGVEILEYYWNFGDGTEGFGPIVTHTYEVADPTISISLTVLDSLGREFSTAKPLSLVIVDFGYISGYTIRGTEGIEVLARDMAVSIDGPAKAIVIRHKNERQGNDQSLSHDVPRIKTLWKRTAHDTSHTTDSISNTHKHLARLTTDIVGATYANNERGKTYLVEEDSVSTYKLLEVGIDYARVNHFQFRQVADQSLTSDKYHFIAPLMTTFHLGGNKPAHKMTHSILSTLVVAVDNRYLEREEHPSYASDEILYETYYAFEKGTPSHNSVIKLTSALPFSVNTNKRKVKKIFKTTLSTHAIYGKREELSTYALDESSFASYFNFENGTFLSRRSVKALIDTLKLVGTPDVITYQLREKSAATYSVVEGSSATYSIFEE